MLPISKWCLPPPEGAGARKWPFSGEDCFCRQAHKPTPRMGRHPTAQAVLPPPPGVDQKEPATHFCAFWALFFGSSGGDQPPTSPHPHPPPGVPRPDGFEFPPRILICSPSNVAIDNVLERLLRPRGQAGGPLPVPFARGDVERQRLHRVREGGDRELSVGRRKAERSVLFGGGNKPCLLDSSDGCG